MSKLLPLRGNTTLEIELPDDWEVTLCPMRGENRTPWTIEQMETAIQNPIGSPRLKTLAKGKRTAVIIFDDITRPTRTYEVAPLVLRELTAVANTPLPAFLLISK